MKHPKASNVNSKTALNMSLGVELTCKEVMDLRAGRSCNSEWIA